MKIIVAAITEPVSLAMARKQCKVDAEGSPPTHEDDDLIATYISGAREWCEVYLGLTVAPSLAEMTLDAFPAATSTTAAGTLPLESGPVLGVDSVTYLDADGVQQILDTALYYLDTGEQIAVLRLAPDAAWPETQTVANAVTVRYVIGYSTPGDSPQDAALPRSIQIAILLLTAHLYKNRESSVEQALQEMPMGVKFFLGPIKLRRGFA